MGRPMADSAADSPGRRKRLFCFGYGFCAAALGERLAREGWSLAGTCRGPERRDALAHAGVEAAPFDRETPLADAG